MSRIYHKNELGFALMWIFIYVGGSSLAENISRSIGLEKCITLPFYIVMSLWLLLFLRRNGLCKEYGLCAPMSVLTKCSGICRCCCCAPAMHGSGFG